MISPAIRLAADSLVVLAGPSGSGKSTWAHVWFDGSQIVSSDELRGVVGLHEHDLRASADAFAILDAIVERRLSRGLVTVVDTLGMDRERIDGWLRIAADHGRPAHLVRFDDEPAVCRRRNKARPNAVPAKVLTAQLDKWSEVRDGLTAGFDEVHPPAAATVVSRALLPAGSGSASRPLRFDLLVSAFEWQGGAQAIASRLGVIAAEAEQAGFGGLWVMDHFMQIPQVGREWDSMLESYTTLAFLAAKTSRLSLGALVSCVTHRNIAHLGKIVATLDVLSGGRARCGLGLGWFEREHRAYGYEFPSVSERYELLNDALEFLPLLWGAGAPAFEGKRFSTAEAIGYPRPLQPKIPILVGGSGERRTLRLAAEYADACNLFGEPDRISELVSILHGHCSDVDRDPATIEVTQLSNVLVAADAMRLSDRVDELATRASTQDEFRTRTNAGTTEQHVDRFGRLGEAGVDTVIVSLADIGIEGAVLGFGDVIAQLGP